MSTAKNYRQIVGTQIPDETIRGCGRRSRVQERCRKHSCHPAYANTSRCARKWIGQRRGAPRIAATHLSNDISLLSYVVGRERGKSQKNHPTRLQYADRLVIEGITMSLTAKRAFLFMTCCQLFAAAPHGWFLAGSNPKEYDTGVDASMPHSGAKSAYLKSKVDKASGFGTLMQSIAAGHYQGKRIQLTGYAKSDQVTGWAGLWMRVDKGRDSVAFDNMQNRAIKGNSGWTQYAVVLDVPNDATGIALGVLLDGPGTIWLSGLNFEVVGAQTPVTGSLPVSTMPAEPENLDFVTP